MQKYTQTHSTHKCVKYTVYAYIVIDSSAINAAIKTKRALYVVLRPQNCFDAQATFI